MRVSSNLFDSALWPWQLAALWHLNETFAGTQALWMLQKPLDLNLSACWKFKAICYLPGQDEVQIVFTADIIKKVQGGWDCDASSVIWTISVTMTSCAVNLSWVMLGLK